MEIISGMFLNLLMFANNLFGSLGWAVVAITTLLKIVLFPLNVPAIKTGKKMRELQPRLKKLQEKYGKDKTKLAKAQMDLYKNEGINPTSGCLPQILQIGVLIIFYSAFGLIIGLAEGKKDRSEVNRFLVDSLKIEENYKFRTEFLGSDLFLTPKTAVASGNIIKIILPLILLVGSGLSQYLGAKMMMPETKVDEKVTKQTKDEEDDMMAAARTQSLYFMPAMTVLMGWNFSVGVLLYWFINSVVGLGQQVVMGKKGR